MWLPSRRLTENISLEDCMNAKRLDDTAEFHSHRRWDMRQTHLSNGLLPAHDGEGLALDITLGGSIRPGGAEVVAAAH